MGVVLVVVVFMKVVVMMLLLVVVVVVVALFLTFLFLSCCRGFPCSKHFLLILCSLTHVLLAKSIGY